MTLRFRLAAMEDVPALQHLIPESVRALSLEYYTSQQIESALRYIFGVDTQLITDGTYYVAEAEEQIVGCGGWSKRRTLYGGDQMKTTEDNLLDPAHDSARIRAFFVHPQWARRGIGRRIIQLCEEAAQQAGFQAAELVATLPGEPLYAAMSYTVIRRFEAAMPDGQALPVAQMVKSLRSPL
jgi:GNAT superfamily N-acetyltransferase